MYRNNQFSFVFLLLFAFLSNSCNSDDQTIKEKEEVKEVYDTDNTDEETELDRSIHVPQTPHSRLDDTEANFYTDKIKKTEKIVTLTGDNNLTDSNTLNTEIENLSQSGGGVLRVQKGTYYIRNVRLRSNIHLKFDSDVILKPYITDAEKAAKTNIMMIDVGNTFFVENVAITNTDVDNIDKNTWYTVEIDGVDSSHGVRYIDASNVSNFKISGIRLTDVYSKFSKLVLNLPDNNNREEIPHKGVVKDVYMDNLHVGYGVVQMQSGIDILYRNLNGKGGVTLRCETGAQATNMVNKISVDNIVARNITIREGDAALNLSPHRVNQGRVDADGIYAYNSGYAVQIAAGWYNTKPNTIDNLGTYDEKSFIDNIVVTGGDGGQIKSKDFKYFCPDFRNIIKSRGKNLDDSSYPIKSIAVIRTNADVDFGCNETENGCYKIGVGKVTKLNNDFLKNLIFLTPLDEVSYTGECK
ncbi:glycoside hydrolase family protein [Wenyingzhuangia aestuarii]|uniref:hypothetical protein n=1 Tax=Wenyingzhuangia aestuarii TaxID=1647582 RepID=UPI00143AC025|nr:hypothetical protein [Wenyingzhuangia aestuarii]NJB81319.1 hypothetical protein [Wenyingzhuangia aestuarii]